ncbi:ATP synthase F0 subunit B [bacterium]|nr:ATP synthase F0 subunit B [bacterium]
MKRILPLITFLLIQTSSVWASEHEAHGNMWQDYLYKCINFFILVFVLVWAIKKPAIEYFKARSLAIRESIEGSRRVFDEASQNNRAIRKKIENLEKESTEIHASYIDSANAESKKIMEEAVIAAQKMRDDVQKVAGLELKKAKEELRETAIVLAKELAEKGIKQELNDADNARLYQSYVGRIKEMA